MIRKVKDGNAEIVECDLDPIVTGRILEGIVNMNAAIVSLLGLSVATNNQVNRDAASVVPTSETTNGGSGSTPCSFSATDPAWIKFRDQQIDLAVKTKGFEAIVAKPEYAEELYKRDRFVPGVWATELFQEVIDRYKLECGVSTDWSFKIDEWNFIVATLHLEGKWC